MVLFYPTIKVTILQLRGAVEKFWKKDRMKIIGGRNKKRILENKKRVRQKRGTPNYPRTVNLIAPVVPKAGGAFNFNPQYPTAGFPRALSRRDFLARQFFLVFIYTTQLRIA